MTVSLFVVVERTVMLSRFSRVTGVRVALLSVASSPAAYPDSMLEHVATNRQDYCDRHGYTCVLATEDVDGACGGNLHR
jgi:hypothetical protein